MNYKVETQQFEGPLDLLLHLIKQSNISIEDISIEEITKQYLEYIKLMEEMNLNIASEYLVMAAELIEIKSSFLLPHKDEFEDAFEEDKKENLINRLLEYEKFKELSSNLKELAEYRQEIYTKQPNNLIEYQDINDNNNYGVDLNDLLLAMTKFIKKQELSKPINTKITNKEYSIKKKCLEIKKIIKYKEKVEFSELLEEISKESIIITFLAILSLTKKQEIIVEQDNNFNNIILKEKR